MRIGKISVVVIGLVPFNVYGECTPTPDCDAIGYTETSCETKSLKCPFDTSKLFCVPCDSSFKYTCSGENITGGTGSACGGKYVSCECSEGSVFKDGACACDNRCIVGAIYYSDGTCSASVDSNKTAIGIVVKDNALVISSVRSTGMKWGTFGVDIPDLANLTDAKVDYNGKANTLAIVSASTSDTVDNNAAINCNSYSTEGTNAGDWYLPAAGELYSYVYGDGVNYDEINTAMITLGWTYGINDRMFWSSSEYDGGYAWFLLDGDMLFKHAKGVLYSVTCFLEIN